MNCPVAPTCNDRDVGENVNMNMTLFDSFLSFFKDGATLTLHDLAEHHHLRHNQSKLENPKFRFGNRDAICSLAQYANIVGVLGRNGLTGRKPCLSKTCARFTWTRICRGSIRGGSCLTIRPKLVRKWIG